MNLEAGNASDVSRSWPDGKKNGWFVGNFDDPPIAGLRGNPHFEIKWFQHGNGHSEDSKPTSGDITNSILISGCFQLEFKPAGQNIAWEKHLLNRPGDYIIWGPGLDHGWKAVETSTVLTVRPAKKTTPESMRAPETPPAGGNE